MSIRIRLKNLGVIGEAEFSLGDLTIICGKNNTGKTYATYAMYGFLESWQNHFDIEIQDSLVSVLRKGGVATVDLGQYADNANRIIAEACEKYTAQLDHVFAASEGRFSESKFLFQTDSPNISELEIDYKMTTYEDLPLIYSKKKGSSEMTVTLVAKDAEPTEDDLHFTLLLTRLFIADAVFSNLFPNVFISSAERTGVTVFRKELNFARKHLLERLRQESKNVVYRSLLLHAYQNYPQPVEENADFISRLEDITKRQSFIAKENPEMLRDFSDIVGGDYSMSPNDQLFFSPKEGGPRLTMVESSSAVRALFDIGIYLRHVAQRGDLLIVDEPELNLHPENQRRIARLLARLVNSGVKVFVTTHSDYIIKELNTLIMLNHDKPHLKRIAKDNGYRDAELINSDQVKVYIAEEVPSEEEPGGHTLVPADIDPVLGIEARSFDETIDDMNRILEDIVWGAE